MSMFKPNTTVACIVKYKSKYLFVEEISAGRRVLNQPAGHLEENETLQQAIEREVQEETGLELSPQGFVGCYQFTSPHNKVTYLRFCYFFEFITTPPPCIPQDDDIIACHWLTLEQLKQRQPELRSAMVLDVIEDYEAGQRAPLSILKSYPKNTV